MWSTDSWIQDPFACSCSRCLPLCLTQYHADGRLSELADFSIDERFDWIHSRTCSSKGTPPALEDFFRIAEKLYPRFQNELKPPTTLRSAGNARSCWVPFSTAFSS